MQYNLHNKRFIPAFTNGSGEVNAQTVFHYRQEGAMIWATYQGGAIWFGTMLGVWNGENLEFVYQHRNKNGAFKTGKCKTSVYSENGKLRLEESWQWTCDDYSSGKSILQEI